MGTGSASSGCSWRATAAPGSAACGVLLPQGVSLTPPAIQDAQRSARPANTLTDRQTDRQTLSRLTARISPRWHFPTEKIRWGKEKQKAETTRKTPLSLSQGTDVIQPPASQDGKRCASSWAPLHPTEQDTAIRNPYQQQRWPKCPIPIFVPIGTAQGGQAGTDALGCCPAIFFLFVCFPKY